MADKNGNHPNQPTRPEWRGLINHCHERMGEKRAVRNRNMPVPIWIKREAYDACEIIKPSKRPLAWPCLPILTDLSTEEGRLEPLAAIIPFLDAGGGKDSPCRSLIYQAQAK